MAIRCTQWQSVAISLDLLAILLLAERDERASKLCGREDSARDERLAQLAHQTARGQPFRRLHVNHRPIQEGGLERYGGCREEDFDAMLALEPLLHDLHVQHPKEAAAQPAPERGRILGRDRYGAVLELEAAHGIMQILEARLGCGEETGEDHGLRPFESGQRRLRIVGRRKRVAHLWGKERAPPW